MLTLRKCYYAVRYFVLAFCEYPTWPLCRVCKWRLLFADDCGWFVIFPERAPAPGKLVCRHCLDYSEDGRKHIELHGVGER